MESIVWTIAASVFLVLNVLAYWLRRKENILRFLSVALFAITNISAAAALFEVYTAIYPLESFYKEEFKKVTGLDFPASGRFLFKDASYPSWQGDYESCAIIEVSREDYVMLRSKMQKQQHTQNPIASECSDNLSKMLGNVTFVGEHFGGNAIRHDKYMYWALIAERPQAIIHYSIW